MWANKHLHIRKLGGLTFHTGSLLCAHVTAALSFLLSRKTFQKPLHLLKVHWGTEPEQTGACSAPQRAGHRQSEVKYFFLFTLFLDFLLAGWGGGRTAASFRQHRVSFACCRSTELLRAGLRGYCEGVWRRGQDITWTFSSYMMGQSGNRISSSRKSTENKSKWSR